MSSFSRRQFLNRASGGFGAIALNGILSKLAQADSPTGFVDPLAPKNSHHPPKASRVIFLYMTGGVSHVESFDHKPKLFSNDEKKITVNNWQGKLGDFPRFLRKPKWGFAPAGQNGTMVSKLFPHTAGVIDDLCVINSMSTDHTNHYESTLGMHCGSWTFARPSIGSWVSYGLGTENENLPAFMVVAPAEPYAGAQIWGSDFLPGCHQGTRIKPGANPIANLRRRSLTDDLQRLELDLIADANRRHRVGRESDTALEARIKSLETAFGMQEVAPDVFDLSRESEATLDMYGVGRGETTGFGWQCLVGRRLAERGVRFIELIDTGSSNNWDSHGNMQDHVKLAKNVDQPIAALVKDLKQRGMFEDTLLVWTTEFGRTPYHESLEHPGREHHHQVFSSWMAGAGVKPGIVYGSSDEHGIAVAEDKVHVHDFHATILHLLGLDHEQLTFRHAGRDYRLTDVHGNVVKRILA